MTYQEGRSLTNIISTILITGVYALIVYQRVLNGISDASNVFRFWAVTIIIFIPISIVARIIIMIVFSIINATIQAANGEEIDIDDIVDERDKLIELKSMRISLIIFSLGFILALVTQVIDMSHHMFFVTLVSFGVISEVISDTTTIIYYRKGV